MKMRPARQSNNSYVRYIAIGAFILFAIDVSLKLRGPSSSNTNIPSSTSDTDRAEQPPANPAAESNFIPAADPDANRDVDSVDARPRNPAQVEGAMGRQIPVHREKCLEFILYYKPPKTGSTAVTDAAREFVQRNGHSDYRCGMLSCGPYAEGVCAGTLEPRQLLGHLSANFSIVDCLKEKNYYVVTSNREPLERWRSAYRYNIQHKKTHYGIPWQVSYKEWMARVPACVLLNYYDGQGRNCGDDVDERIEKIVSMVDEVVDLYDDQYKGDLHKSIEPYLGESNVSDVGDLTIEYPDLPEELDARLDAERKLYNALKKRSTQPPAAGRRLCLKDVNRDEEDVEG